MVNTTSVNIASVIPVHSFTKMTKAIADKAFDSEGQLTFDIFNFDGFMGDINTVNGDITVGVNSHVKGGIKVEKNKSMFPVKLGRDPRVIIGPKAVVEGPLVFERPVTLYVHRTAKTGPVTGATAKIFDTDTAPTE